MSSGVGDAPVPAGGFTIYNSYSTDPTHAEYLTYAALALLGLVTVPNLIQLCRHSRRHSLRQLPYSKLNPNALALALGLNLNLFGLSYNPAAPLPLPSQPGTHHRARSPGFPGLSSCLRRLLYYTPPLPGQPLSLGSLFALIPLPLIILPTLLNHAELAENANRPGFLALACLPWLFLLGGKSTGLATLVGIGYERINFFHRALGRAALALVLLHFGLWTAMYARKGREYALNMLSQPKQASGLLALAFFLITTLPSIAFVRRLPVFGWRLFKFLHVLGFVGVVVGANRHTPYAWRWTKGVIVVYAVDVLGRWLSYRFVTVRVEHGGLGVTRLSVEGVTHGWRAGQHVRLRLFYPGIHPTAWTAAEIWQTLWRVCRPLESHPLTISNAPPALSVSGTDAELVLFCHPQRAGGWTADLSLIAGVGMGRTLLVSGLVDGPYGGLPAHADLTRHHAVLLIAGGSGMSFVLGLLDELVGCARLSDRHDHMQTIHLVWCVSALESTSAYLGPLGNILSAATSFNALTLTATVHYKSRRPRPEPASTDATDVPSQQLTIDEIPDVALDNTRFQVRPAMRGFLDTLPSGRAAGRGTGVDEKGGSVGQGHAGGVGVVVCGPTKMIREVRNTVSSELGRVGRQVGGIELYSETFGI